jgi:hypothetical protein
MKSQTSLQRHGAASRRVPLPDKGKGLDGKPILYFLTPTYLMTIAVLDWMQ